MLLRGLAERKTQAAMKKLEAEIAAVWRRCKSRNALSREYILAERKVAIIQARLNELRSGRKAYEMLDEVQEIAETGFKRLKQVKRFGKSGGEAKRKPPAWEKKIKSTAKTILAKRKRQPSVRELARTILKELKLPESEFETVRKRLPKILGK